VERLGERGSTRTNIEQTQEITDGKPPHKGYMKLLRKKRSVQPVHYLQRIRPNHIGHTIGIDGVIV
jgi:hypothetical protein